MCASGVTATLDRWLVASGLDRATVVHRPWLLSDNGSSYVASDLAAWLDEPDGVFGLSLIFDDEHGGAALRADENVVCAKQPQAGEGSAA
jgi:hypothetical protein